MNINNLYLVQKKKGKKKKKQENITDYQLKNVISRAMKASIV